MITIFNIVSGQEWFLHFGFNNLASNKLILKTVVAIETLSNCHYKFKHMANCMSQITNYNFFFYTKNFLIGNCFFTLSFGISKKERYWITSIAVSRKNN